MKQYILASVEAEVLSSIDNDDEASIYEITTATRLTPSEVIQVLHDLRDRDLVRLTEEDRQVQLTNEGRHVRVLLDRQGKQFLSGSGQREVLVIGGTEAARASRRAFEDLPSEDLDLALDSEFRKLEQEAMAGQT